MSAMLAPDPITPNDPNPATPPDKSTIPVHDSTKTPPTTNLPEWLKDVDPEIANDPSLKVFTNYKDLVKSYVHAQKSLGNKVALPGKNSTDEDWKQFYRKVGLPDSMDTYELKKGEKYSVADDALAEFKKLAFENNMMPSQAQKVMDWLNDRANNTSEKMAQKAEQEVVDGWNNLKKEWGAGFDKNMAAAKTVLKEFGDEEFDKYLDKTGFNDDPIVAKFLAKIGAGLKEDVFNEDITTTANMTPAEAKSRYQEIMADKNHAYLNKAHPNHKNAVAEVSKLFALM